MLIENTGVHMLDSGGDNGRMWQRNQGKTLQNFMNEPEVSYEFDSDEPKDSSDINYTISVFHYLTKNIELNDECNAFNKTEPKDWDSEVYGTSQAKITALKKKGFVIGESFNTYNYNSSLSQVLQGTFIKRDSDNYVLLQIHGGCDVRGGYTNAKMFYLPNDYMPIEDVDGEIDGVYVSNVYDGYTLRMYDDGVETDKYVPVKHDSNIKLFLRDY